jgi:hypothetical protein
MTTFSDNIQATRAQQALKDKERAEFNGMIAEMKRTQAAVLAGGSKPSVVLTDQTDLGDKVGELTTKVTAAIKDLDLKVVNNQQLEAIRSVISAVQSLEQVVDSYITALDRQTVQIVSALKKIELSPRITVPTPQVTVKSSDVNLKPLETAINSLKSTTVSLADYRSHDLDTAPDGSQYIGYIAMDGSWYIIQSNESTNTMRYYFGKGAYSTGWDERYSHDYTVLSEAIHALAT